LSRFLPVLQANQERPGHRNYPDEFWMLLGGHMLRSRKPPKDQISIEKFWKPDSKTDSE
jgi:hypothetical protein